jgi:Small-conductance mechanosensitive channel
LHLDETYRVGSVLLESGERGIVKNVGIRSTTVLIRNNILVPIPNSVLNDARVINQSAPEHKKRIRIPISIAYDTDLDLVNESINEICEEHDRILENPAPRFYLPGFGDSALDFELRVYTAHPLHKTIF